MNATKEKLGSKEALEFVRRHQTLVVAKGKKVVTVKLKDAPTDDEILALVMGPTGNLRAPSWTRGTTAVVGFDAEAYKTVLGV